MQEKLIDASLEYFDALVNFVQNKELPQDPDTEKLKRSFEKLKLIV